jgi:hypothetical protein
MEARHSDARDYVCIWFRGFCNFFLRFRVCKLFAVLPKKGCSSLPHGKLSQPSKPAYATSRPFTPHPSQSGCPHRTPNRSSFLLPHEPPCSEGFKTKKWGFRSARRECPVRHTKAHVQRPPLATFGSNSRVRSPWTTGLTEQWCQCQGKAYSCGWVKPNGTPTKGQLKQGSTRKGEVTYCYTDVCSLLAVVCNPSQLRWFLNFCFSLEFSKLCHDFYEYSMKSSF